MSGDGLAALYRRVEARYRDRSRFTRGFVHWKLRLDPVLRAVLELARDRPLGSIVDVGCGRGQLGIALIEAGAADRLTGLDWDEALLADAEAAAGGRGSFLRADMRTAEVPPGDTVLLIDLLYLMPAEAQLALLKRAAAAARGRLVLRVFDPERGWRSAVGWLSEAGIRLARLYRRTETRPLPLDAIRAGLAEAGFACTVEPCWGAMPLPNVLVVARRQA